MPGEICEEITGKILEVTLRLILERINVKFLYGIHKPSKNHGRNLPKNLDGIL